jgi:hypothetical protein
MLQRRNSANLTCDASPYPAPEIKESGGIGTNSKAVLMDGLFLARLR